jgi:hypothetical protein
MMSEPADQPPPTPPPTAPKRDVVAEFKAMLPAEKMLVIAALAVLLAFIFAGRWEVLFKYLWFPTCAFLGAVCILASAILDLVGTQFLKGKTRTYVMILLGVLPAIGFVIDALHNFWHAVMLAGAIVMGFAAVKITTRENIIKR